MTSSPFHWPRWRTHAAPPLVLALCWLCQAAAAQPAAPLAKEPSVQHQPQKKVVAAKPPGAASAVTGKAALPKQPQPGGVKPELAVAKDAPAAGSGKAAVGSQPVPAIAIAPTTAAASSPQAKAAASARWSLPAVSTVQAAAGAAALQPAKRSGAMALSPVQRGELTLSVLQRHGFRGADIGGLRQGLRVGAAE